MGNALTRYFQAFLNLVGLNKRKTTLQLESPVPKDDTSIREVRLPKPVEPIPFKLEWESFLHQPTLTSADLIATPGSPVELEYVDPNSDEIKYVLIGLSVFGWKVARMNPVPESKGTYNLKFNVPGDQTECAFKFIVNDQWTTSDKYKLSSDGIGGYNNHL